MIGAILGLATAVVLGFLMYRGAVRLNLTALFTWTGALLVIVAGGILRYAVHEFQELGWLPGEDNVAFDLTSTFPADGVIATFARGLLSITPKMTWLEVAVWLAYVIPTLVAFFWVISRRPSPRTPESSGAAAPEAVADVPQH